MSDFNNRRDFVLDNYKILYLIRNWTIDDVMFLDSVCVLHF